MLAQLRMKAFNRIGLGLSGRFQAPIQDKLNWTAAIGFVSFTSKEFNFGNSTFKYNSITLIPVIGGIQYYFKQTNNGLYASGELGLYFAKGGDASETKFGFAQAVAIGMASGILVADLIS